MAFHQAGPIRYLTFDSLAGFPLTHAVFTRRGGVSPQPWDQLNVSITVGDDRQNVINNHALCFETVGRDVRSNFDSWLVHGTEVAVAEQPRPLDLESHPKADIILTDNPEVTLFMRYADCVPIFLYDPLNRSVGLAHAGWKGSLLRVAAVAVRAMQNAFNSDPGAIQAILGPSIGLHHYEVGAEVVAQVEDAFPGHPDLLIRNNGAAHFDLWAANRLALQEAGVRDIEVSGICTACHLDDWYSHRAEGGRTGRFGALIGLDPV
jgi:hypothetical protein